MRLPFAFALCAVLPGCGSAERRPERHYEVVVCGTCGNEKDSAACCLRGGATCSEEGHAHPGFRAGSLGCRLGVPPGADVRSCPACGDTELDGGWAHGR